MKISELLSTEKNILDFLKIVNENKIPINIKNYLNQFILGKTKLIINHKQFLIYLIKNIDKLNSIFNIDKNDLEIIKKTDINLIFDTVCNNWNVNIGSIDNSYKFDKNLGFSDEELTIYKKLFQKTLINKKLYHSFFIDEQEDDLLETGFSEKYNLDNKPGYSVGYFSVSEPDDGYGETSVYVYANDFLENIFPDPEYVNFDINDYEEYLLFDKSKYNKLINSNIFNGTTGVFWILEMGYNIELLYIHGYYFTMYSNKNIYDWVFINKEIEPKYINI